MFCSNCGTRAEGNFCSRCGHGLAQEIAANGLEASDEPIFDEPDVDEEVSYAALMRLPGVRLMIARHAATARKGMSGEAFLAKCDEVLSLGVPLEKIATFVVPMYASWGIGTGKAVAFDVHAPVREVLLRVLCSLAQNGQTLRDVKQAADGCALTAILPSDIWSFEGEMLVTVTRQGAMTHVDAATKIKGQLFDWGKSSRVLEALTKDVREGMK